MSPTAMDHLAICTAVKVSACDMVGLLTAGTAADTRLYVDCDMEALDDGAMDGA